MGSRPATSPTPSQRSWWNSSWLWSESKSNQGCIVKVLYYLQSFTFILKIYYLEYTVKMFEGLSRQTV